MSLRQKITDAIRVESAKRLPKKPAGARGDEKSPKQVDRHDKFEEKGALGKDFKPRSFEDDEDEDYHPISKSSKSRIAKSISRGRANAH